MIKKDEILQIKIEDFANEGKSISRYENFVIFIDNGIPGDIAEIKIYKIKKNFAFAKAINIIQPSGLRELPRCKFFGVCGGCKWQNLNYKSQLEFKRNGIIDSFQRIGNIENPIVNDVIPSEDIFFFRNKMEFSFSNKRWLLEEEKDNLQSSADFALGLHIPERFDKVLDINECFLQSEISNKILNFTRQFAKNNNLDAFSTKTQSGYLRNLVIRESRNISDLMVNIVTYNDKPELMNKYKVEILESIPQITTIVNNITQRRAQVATGEREIILYGPGYIREKLDNYIFQISANSFFQTNTKGTEKLYSVVKDFAGQSKHSIIWDLYCGAGTISLYISDLSEKVVGFELIGSAIKDAEKNAILNSIKNCTFVSGDLKDSIMNTSFPTPDLVILDPPRSGVHEKVLIELLEIFPERIIYVSCNPQTQARDLNIIKSKYNIKAIQPVDMFPHTMHIENVVLMEKIL